MRTRRCSKGGSRRGGTIRSKRQVFSWLLYAVMAC
uniref:Uncharacterized protein n=1 Tax=Arundo donax TaxID=35708 RepID=A0A0A9HVT9_ARUDO